MRRSRKLAATALVGTILATAFGVAGASAETGTSDGNATSEETTTDSTFTLEASSTAALQITVPDEDTTTGVLNLGTTSLDGLTWSDVAFGAVRVVDTRAVTVGWTAKATGSNFCIDSDAGTVGVQCGSDPNQQVLSTAIVYDPGALSLVGGLGDLSDISVNTPGTLSAGAIVSYVGTGSSDITWNATLDFTFLPTQVAGTYRGAVYHDVT